MAHTDVLTSINACVIIPTYNNAKTLPRVIEGVLSFTSRLIVVNDGSTDQTPDILSKYPLLARIDLPENHGKGNALREAFRLAGERQFDYAITLDSDGQHFPEDIPTFVREIEKNGMALLIGDRNMSQAGIPGKSSFGNRFSNFWFRFETGLALSDTQSGFRLYPLREIRDIRLYTNKFEFEIEVIVKAAWRGIPVRNVPVRVLYDPEERVSHFRPFRDFTRITILNTWLVMVTLFYIRPRDYFRTFKKKGIRRFFFEDLLHSDDPPLKKALSVALGVFIGFSPLWGAQTVVVLFLAWILRLNKLIAFAFSNVSIPPFIPFIVYACLQTGNLLMGHPHTDPTFEWNRPDTYRPYVQQHLTEYVVGSLVLGLLAATLAGAIAYLMLNIRSAREARKTT